MNTSLEKTLFTVLLLLATTDAGAQYRWLEATAGPAFSFSPGKNNFSTNVKMLPQGGITAFIPFSKTLALKTGLIYQQKGLNYYDLIPDSLKVMNSIESSTLYHYLNIPLQIAYSFEERKDQTWRLAAGMSYGFLLMAVKEIKISTYDDNIFVSAESSSFRQPIGIDAGPHQSGLPGQEGTALYVFTPALRADIGWVWQRKIVLGAFYEYNLQDNRMRIHQNQRRMLHYTGISVGVTIR
jgi:hypothetical protein